MAAALSLAAAQEDKPGSSRTRGRLEAAGESAWRPTSSCKQQESRCPLRHLHPYTRKSSEEGLEQAFNSLDAQRETCEAYVFSQKHEGWMVLPQMYDDGGFSGGSLDRPSLKRLLADIAERPMQVGPPRTAGPPKAP